MSPIENPWPAAFAFTAVAVVFAILWSSQKRAWPLVASIVCVLAAGGMFLIDQAVITDAEQIELHVRDLAAAFQQKDLERVTSYFSPLCDERPLIATAAAMVTVGDDLRISDVDVEMKARGSRAIIHFRANATVSLRSVNLGYHPSRWRLTWQREGGEWKIVTVTRLDPIRGEPLSILSGNR